MCMHMRVCACVCVCLIEGEVTAEFIFPFFLDLFTLGAVGTLQSFFLVSSLSPSSPPSIKLWGLK